jgi:RNA polymerase sigma factor (sigma-70 family)
LTSLAGAHTIPDMEPSPSKGEPTDEQLAETVAQRDQSEDAWQQARAACGKLYGRHARQLLAFLAGRVRRADLEDVHQAVWERVWQHLAAGFHGGSFRGWLYQLTRNYVIDQERKKRPDRLGDDGEPVDPRGGRPEDSMMQAEDMRILSQCLKQLDERSAAVVRSRLAGEGYEAICARLSLSMEVAHKVFHRAKEQLQSCVRRAGP